jgi:hypothetical protein
VLNNHVIDSFGFLRWWPWCRLLLNVNIPCPN